MWTQLNNCVKMKTICLSRIQANTRELPNRHSVGG
nr:unnamed protein product [Callosobruchus analis]